jgi:hypothetical protein
MRATTFHRDIALESGDGATSSAELTIRSDLRVEVTRLDGTTTDHDAPATTRCVHIKMPASGSFNLAFELPNAATTATFKYGSNGVVTMNRHTTSTPDFDVTSGMIDEPVTCSLQWGDLAAPVTITVRPRSSSDGSGERSV